MSAWHREYASRVRGDSGDVLLEVGAWTDGGGVEVEIEEGELSLSVYLTARQAREVAAALVRSAERLDALAPTPCAATLRR